MAVVVVVLVFVGVVVVLGIARERTSIIFEVHVDSLSVTHSLAVKEPYELSRSFL